MKLSRTNGRRQRKKMPMLLLVVLPLMLLLLVEGVVLVGGFYGQGISQKLRDNAEDIVDSRTLTRRNGLERTMSGQWMNLSHTVTRLNQYTEQGIAAGEIDLNTLDDSSQTAEGYLNQVTEELIALMRSNRVSGAFLVLNTEDLSHSMEQERYKNKPGLYLRDLDPNSRASERNEDILIERSPASVVSNYRLATDTNWNVCFAFGNDQLPYYDFFYKPMQAALENPSREWHDLGYWSTPYTLEGEDRQAVAYSVPLILDSGEVYGVLGVDVLLDEMMAFLPYEELDSSGKGVYFVGYQENPLVDQMNYLLRSAEEDSGLFQDVEPPASDSTYLYKELLHTDNSPEIYGSGQWWFGAILDYEYMDAFSNNLIYSTGVSLFVSLLIGVLGSILVGFWLQRPVQTIVQGLRKQNPGQLFQLDRTGILELDEMADSLEILNKRLLEEQEKIRYERDHDFLTGLYNRRAFDREMRILLETKVKEGGIGAYVMMDLDNLKLVNDTYGHEYGDKYINAAANGIRNAIGDEGLYSRVSGDEFNIFLFRQDGNRKKIESMIAKVSNSLYSAYVDLPGGNRQFVRISGGISWYPEEGKTTSELAKKADLAMYVVKKATKEQIRRGRRKS